jgi:hypothetical protein
VARSIVANMVVVDMSHQVAAMYALPAPPVTPEQISARESRARAAKERDIERGRRAGRSDR